MKHKTTFEKLPQANTGRSKNWKTLRTICLLLFLSVSFTAYSQITVNVKDISLRASLKKIEQVSNYKFFYNESLPELNRKVSLNVKDATIEQTMQQLLGGMDLAYKKEQDNVIVLIRKAQDKSITKKITGTVVDEKGEPVIGASIVIKGESHGTITDFDGKFTLADVPEKGILTVSYIGYKTVDLSATGQTFVKVVLQEDSKMIDEVVVVGYGKQKKESVTASIASISRKELVQTQQSNISNMLVGRMPGLIAFQRSGAPGEDASSLLIRGVSTFTDNTAPLIMIDGIERTNFDGIDPNEVESLNILKDASATAIYGVKGANGVVLITTRKGERGRPRLSYSGNFALQQSTQLPSYLNSADYATLYNEALENDSRVSGSTYQPKFTDKDIELYRNGFDPILHPNTNWIDDFLRKFSTRTQHNINLSGGTERVKYFISGSYFDQTGIYKHTKIDSDHDVNPRNTRYNFRTNFDFQITRDFSATVQMAAQIGRVITPGSGNSGIWQAISFANPLSSPGLVDNKIVRIQDGLGSVNPWQTLLSNGYQKDNRNNINTTLRLNYDLSSLLTKGLSVHGSIAYDSYYYSRKKYSKTFPYYLARRDAEDPDYIYLIPQSEESIWSVSTGWDKNRKVYMEFGIDYNRTFGLHKTTALILYNQSKYYSPSLQYYVPNAYQGLVGRLT